MTKPKRWIFKGQNHLFTIYNTGSGRYNLTVGDSGQVIGNYSSPTDAVIALCTRTTENKYWNEALADDDVPKSFKDWEPEEKY